ncbi:MAG: isoaspartyl peptidase/L-asparaginase [Planctomycetota bacterium]
MTRYVWILCLLSCLLLPAHWLAAQEKPVPKPAAAPPAGEQEKKPETQPATPAESAPNKAAEPEPSKNKYAIAIHGGAGSSAKNASAASIAKRKASLKTALQKGVGILESGGSALEAVENVIVILENDPQFNAGKGAVFNAAGSHELDASIMDGKNGACGAVAGVSHVKNPISLARLVMTETPHVLLSGTGAEVFAKKQNVHWVEPNYFDTPRAKASFERFKLRIESQNAEKKKEAEDASKKRPSPAEQTLLRIRGAEDSKFERQWNIGTVGCVALDANGNLAAGTSTGGMTYKQFGRVGDSPIVGAGTYADNATCAVSSTGIGEEYIRNVVAYDVAAQMKYKNSSLTDAVQDNLKRRLRKGDGGLIAVDKDGNIEMGFNTGGMARAAADSDGRFEIIWGDATPKPKEATKEAAKETEAVKK